MSQFDFFFFALFYHNTDKHFITMNEAGNLWKAFLHCFTDLKLQTNKNHQTRQTCISNCDSQTTIFIFIPVFYHK